MKTGIVILNYNDYKTTLKMIKQIESFSNLDKIIVVDNHSTDNSYNILKEKETSKIHVIKTSANNGYAAGNNFGIKYLEKFDIDYVIISNPDIIVTEDAIKNLLESFKDEKISLIAPVIKQHDEIIRGWKLPKFKDDLISNYNNKLYNAKIRYPKEYYQARYTEVEVVSGCFFIISLKVLKDINYFDEATFLYYEENILGKKLKDKNYHSFIDNEISIIHDLSISVNKKYSNLKKFKILKQSQRYYQRKYNNLNIFGIFILYITYLITYLLSALRRQS